MDIQKLVVVQKKNEKKLLKKANVVSVGYGYKFIDGKVTDEVVLIVGVTNKVSVRGLKKKDIVPKSIDDVNTDVQQVGKIKALQFDPTQRHRPAPPGSSLGHFNITSGTFGAVVKRNELKVILSNNHVLADSNNGQKGDAIYQPGPYDSGTSSDTIASLYDFVPISFGGDVIPPKCPVAKIVAKISNFCARVIGSKHRLYAVKSFQSLTNIVDAALALPIVPKDIKADIAEIGKPVGLKEATLGMEVQKFGRTTHYTKDIVVQLNVTTSVSYGSAGTAIFEKQIMAGPMSAGGDSGSTVLDMDNNLIGLLFAGSDQVTILNPIQDVFKLLNITL